MTTLCSDCGEHRAHTRGLCSACYQRSQRQETPIASPRWECRNVTMVYCPRDPVMGVSMYPAPCFFPRLHFLETLAEEDGCWPDGCIVEYALQYRGRKTRWRVSGHYLLEVGTERVAVGEFGPGEHARVRLMPARAKGA